MTEPKRSSKKEKISYSDLSDIEIVENEEEPTAFCPGIDNWYHEAHEEPKGE